VPRRPLGRASDAALGSRDAGSYAKVPPIAVGSGRAAHRAAWNLSCVFLFPFLAPTLTLSLALGYEICNP